MTIMSTKEVEERLQQIALDVEAYLQTAELQDRDLTEEEDQAIQALIAEKEKLETRDLPRAKAREDLAKRAAVRFRDEQNNQSRMKVPAIPRAQRSKVFKGPTANEDAYASGQFLLATVFGNPHSKQWCADHGLEIRNAMGEGTGSSGGYLVPDPLADTIVNLQEDYGVFQRNTTVLPMTSETLAFARRTAGLTVYYPGENTAITASDLTLAQATLTAKKYATLTLVSSELSEDSVISIADLITDEIARRFANAIDTNAFLGDGTSSYASVTGFTNALHANSIYTAATGNTSFATLDLGDFEGALAMLPQYPGAQNKWYINSYGYFTSMVRLMNAAGGNTTQTLANGLSTPMFMGFPVEFTQVLPGSGASAGDVVAFFGDVSLASTMGLRRQIAIATSTEVKFVEDQIAIRGLGRFAILVHEGVDASPVGPVVGLKLAAA